MSFSAFGRQQVARGPLTLLGLPLIDWALGIAGAVYGPVYQAHGFYAVSFASAATVAVAALIALKRSLAVSPGSPLPRR